VIVKSIRLTGVKCFKSALVEFVPGKNVLIGRNGSGKSTVLQAILFALYGVYPQGTNADLIRKGEQTAEIELEFEHAGEYYSIKRRIHRNRSAEALLVHQGMGQATKQVTSVEREVTSILQTPREVFQNAVYVRQGEIAHIIDMTQSERKNLFDRIIGLHEYETAWQRCRDVENRLETMIKTAQSSIDALEPAARPLDERKRTLKELREKQKEVRDRLRGTKKKLRESEAELRELDKRLKRIEQLRTRVMSDWEREAQVSKQLEAERETTATLCTTLGFPQPSPQAEELQALLTSTESHIDETRVLLKEEHETREALVAKKQELESLSEQYDERLEEIERLRETVNRTRKTIRHDVPSIANMDEIAWAEKIQEMIESVEARRTEIGQQLKKLAVVREGIGQTREQIANVESQVRRLNQRLRRIKETVAKEGGANWRRIAKKEPKELRLKIRSLEGTLSEKKAAEKKLVRDEGRLQQRKSMYEKDLESLSQLQGKKCPKCKQTVSEEHASRLRGELREKILDIEHGLDDLDRQQQQLRRDISDIEAEIERLRKEEKLVDSLRLQLQAEADVKRDLEGLKEQRKKLRQQLGNLQQEFEEIEADEPEKKEGDLARQAETLRARFADARLLEQSVRRLSELQEQTNTLNSQINAILSEDVDMQITQNQDRIDALQDKLENLRKLRESLRACTKIVRDLSDLKSKIERSSSELALLESGYDSNHHKALAKSVDGLREEKARLETENLMLKERIPQERELYQQARDAARKIKEKEKEHDRATRMLEIVKKLREFYRAVQEPLRQRHTTVASQYATGILRALIETNEFDRVMISPRYDLEISRFGTFESMSRLSGGEQVVAALAVRLGFARALTGSDLLILDEPTTYLDDQRREELIELFYRTTPTNQMIVVTHDEDFERIAHRVIHMKKDEMTMTSVAKWIQ